MKLKLFKDYSKPNIKMFEGVDDYKNNIRKVTNYIHEVLIRSDILNKNDNKDKYPNLFLTLIPTNLIVKREYEDLISNNFYNNLNSVLSKIDRILDIMANTNKRGLWAELVTKYLLEDKFKLIVTQSTADEDISGVDLHTPNNTHQVKIIYNYVDDGKIFKTDSFIDIKEKDKYDYIWFFASDTNELICFKKLWIIPPNGSVNRIWMNPGYEYKISYSDIKKFDIPENIVKSLRFEAEVILKDAGQVIRDNIEIFHSADKYNL